MKKVLFTVLFTMIFTLILGCDNTRTTTVTTTKQITEDINETIDCIPGYSWSNGDDRCILNTDAYIFGEDTISTYKIQYEGNDYTVYRAYVFFEDDTNSIVDIGDYNGYHYFFSSDTYYDYYLVEKNGEYKKLLEAMQSSWFTLEELITDFNISQLQSEEIS